MPDRHNLSEVLNKFLSDIDLTPEEALPQSFAFLTFIQSQSIPKVPQPPPDLEPFDLGVNEEIERMSNRYRDLIKQKHRKNEKYEVVKSSTDRIIRALPNYLEQRGASATDTSDLVVGSIAERMLYPDVKHTAIEKKLTPKAVVTVNQ